MLSFNIIRLMGSDTRSALSKRIKALHLTELKTAEYNNYYSDHKKHNIRVENLGFRICFLGSRI